MAVLSVIKIGNPILRKKARRLSPAELASDETQRLIDDMVETMREMDGVGLAAPQVAQSLDLLVMEVAENPRYPDFPSMPLTVLVNIEIVNTSDHQVEDWEGCLSIPDIRGLVDRHEWVQIRALDRHGQPVEMRLEDFPARILQHEHDHLIGVIFLERMKSFRSLGYIDEIVRHAPEEAEALARAD